MAEPGKRYHHGDLRAALLAQAEHKLAREGTQALSLRELARELGVSHGAPRAHFRSKQALLDALAAAGFQRLGHELETAMAGTERTFIEGLTVFAETYVHFASDHPALIDLMFSSIHRSGADPRLRRANDRAFAAPIELIAKAHANGDIVADDPDRVAMAVLAVLQGLVWLATSTTIGDRPIGVVVAETIETLTYGLKPRPSRGRKSEARSARPAARVKSAA